MILNFPFRLEVDSAYRLSSPPPRPPFRVLAELLLNQQQATLSVPLHLPEP